MSRSMTHFAAVLVALAFTCSVQVVHAQRVSWVKTLVGPTFDMVDGMVVSPDGTCNLIGTFSDSVSVDGIVLQAVGTYDIFTARFSGKGNPVTASSHGSFDADEGRSIVVDNKGNTYFAGSFIDLAVVAGEQIEGLSATSTDMFVAKISKEGILQWVKVFGSPTYDEGAPSVAVDSAGFVYVAGGVGGSGQFGTKSYKAVGKLDAFVAKMSAAGDFLWVQGAGSSENDQTLHVHVTPNGDRVYAVGTFIGLVNFGSNAIESFAGKSDFFVRALSTSGQPLWCKRIGSSESDIYIGANTTREGKLVIAGAMHKTTTFDTQTLKANGENDPDAFVARLNQEGTFELLRRYGDIFSEIPRCIVADARGNMFVGGSFDSTTIMESFQQESQGQFDGFVMRIQSNGDLDWVRAFGGPYDDVVTAVGLDARGIPYIAGNFDSYAYFDDQRVEGEGFDDGFVAALDCGPSTLLRPDAQEIKFCEGMDRPITARLGYPSYEWYVNGAKDPEARNVLQTRTLKAGTYKVYCRIKGHDECIKNTDTITVIVTPGLAIPTITRNGDDLNCSADRVNYQWYREGQKINGATSRSVKVQGDGNYRVLISDTAGCERWSENFLVGTTSVNDLLEGTTIAIYPNPTSGAVTIAGAEGIEVTVRDVMGRVVSVLSAASAMETVVLDGAAGMYVVTLRSSGDSRTILLQKR